MPGREFDEGSGDPGTPFAGADMIKADTNAKKIEEIIKVCQAAIAKQVDQNRKGGFGLDDYTDGRTIGGASLARNILRLIGRSY